MINTGIKGPRRPPSTAGGGRQGAAGGPCLPWGRRCRAATTLGGLRTVLGFGAMWRQIGGAAPPRFAAPRPLPICWLPWRWWRESCWDFACISVSPHACDCRDTRVHPCTSTQPGVLTPICVHNCTGVHSRFCTSIPAHPCVCTPCAHSHLCMLCLHTHKLAHLQSHSLRFCTLHVCIALYLHAVHVHPFACSVSAL